LPSHRGRSPPPYRHLAGGAATARLPALLRCGGTLFAALARPALPAALARRGMAFLLAAARARFLAAARFLVHRRPGAAFGLLVARPAFFIAFLDMLGLALLLVG